MPEKIKIFIVDDHPVVRHGLTRFINSNKNFTVCGDAEDANSAISAINDCLPDIVIIDINLKGISGIELIKAIKSRYKKILILVLSMHEENEYIERAIKAGAMGYVSKRDCEDLVIDAINNILNGKMYLSSCLRDKMLESMLWNSSDEKEKSLNNLTNRELEIFEMIGKGLSTRDIANALNLSSSTIGTYRERIKTKLKISSPNELVQYAIKQSLKEKD